MVQRWINNTSSCLQMIVGSGGSKLKKRSLSHKRFENTFLSSDVVEKLDRSNHPRFPSLEWKRESWKVRVLKKFPCHNTCKEDIECSETIPIKTFGKINFLLTPYNIWIYLNIYYINVIMLSCRSSDLQTEFSNGSVKSYCFTDTIPLSPFNCIVTRTFILTLGKIMKAFSLFFSGT